jgi:hypothetical protein
MVAFWIDALGLAARGVLLLRARSPDDAFDA